MHLLCAFLKYLCFSSKHIFLIRLPIDVKQYGFFSLLTTVSWSYELFNTPAPALVKVASAISLYVAYRTRGVVNKSNWRRFALLQTFVDVVAIQTLALKKPLTDVTTLLAILAARLGVYFFAANRGETLKGSEGAKAKLIALFAALELYLCAYPPKFGIQFLFGSFLWVVALLTSKPWLYYWYVERFIN